MKNKSIAILIFAEPGSSRNALTEEKYKNLADAFLDQGFDIYSVIYHDNIADKLITELQNYDALLVWVNPIEQGNNRKRLDSMLAELSAKGVFVSAHPEVILKIGTKEILYKIRETKFGGDCKLYHSFDDFKKQFSNYAGEIRILKQYRGNGGNGVFKIDTKNVHENKICVTHAVKSAEEYLLSLDNFFNEFKTYFDQDGILIDQEWNPGIVNGMVRCYLTGVKVSGFGYQEVNALYPKKPGELISRLPGKRYYYSEDCGLFQDLREIMEKKWVPQLQKIASIENELMPVIWDADFFINKINAKIAGEKYTLCEINVSCVSPFPESCIPNIIEDVRNKIKLRHSSMH